jgi:NADPH-dependent glutamate synthase beta subunit-like oxidoreductase
VTLSVAVVGTGPSGCYAAEGLARKVPGCRIDVIDRRPVPYGLIRAGVAPDHQTTKGASRVLDRLFEKGQAAFLGGVEVGRDVSLDELRALYDAVVVATGPVADRTLACPGADLPGVVGSGAFSRWYNADAADGPDLAHVRDVVVVGNGNVAIDAARVLAKTPAELARSDMAPTAEAAIAAAPVRSITVVGRRGPGETSFSVNELKELAHLVRATPVVDPADLADDGAPISNAAAMDVLRGFPAEAPEGRIPIRFRFRLAPAGFAGEGRAERAAFARMRFSGGAWAPTGEREEIPCDLAVTCIGYACAPGLGLSEEGGRVPNEGGRIADGLYVVGWAKRGPSGTIASNRTDSHEVAARLAAEVAPAGRPGGEGLRALLAQRGVAAVDWEGWKRIDAAEAAAAGPDRVRAKFADPARLLAAARG